MKKKLIYLVSILVLPIIFVQNVKAVEFEENEIMRCHYVSNDIAVGFDLKVYKDCSVGGINTEWTSDITKDDFRTNDKWYCPKMVKTEIKDSKTIVSFKNVPLGKYSEYCDNNSGLILPKPGVNGIGCLQTVGITVGGAEGANNVSGFNTSQGFNENTVCSMRDSSGKEVEVAKECKYGQYSVYISTNGDLSASGTQSTVDGDKTKFANSCPSSVYVKEIDMSSGNYNDVRATISTEANACTTSDYANNKKKTCTNKVCTLNGTCTVIEPDKIIRGDNTDCRSLLTENVQKVLQNILSFIQYLGPILVILLTVFDLIKAALSGEQDEMKKVGQKLIKRLIAAVLLFFIPILVNLILDLAGITAPAECFNIK